MTAGAPPGLLAVRFDEDTPHRALQDLLLSVLEYDWMDGAWPHLSEQLRRQAVRCWLRDSGITDTMRVATATAKLVPGTGPDWSLEAPRALATWITGWLTTLGLDRNAQIAADADLMGPDLERLTITLCTGGEAFADLQLDAAACWRLVKLTVRA